MGIPAGPHHLGDMVTFTVNTHDPATGGMSDADSAPTYRVYDMDAVAQVTSGTMVKLDDANTTGFYTGDFDASTGNGFFANMEYSIYIEATVGGVTATTSFNFRLSQSLYDGTAQVSLKSLTVNNTDGDAVIFSSGDGFGLTVNGTSGGAVIISEAGAGLTINSDAWHALEVVSGSSNAMLMQSGADLDATVRIDNIGAGPAIQIDAEDNAAVAINSGGAGINIMAAGFGVGIQGSTGMTVESTSGHALELLAAGGQGLRVYSDTEVAASIISDGSAPAMEITAIGGGIYVHVDSGDAPAVIMSAVNGPALAVNSTNGVGFDIGGFTTGMKINCVNGEGLLITGVNFDLAAREITNMYGSTGIGYGYGTSLKLDDVLRLMSSTTVSTSAGLDTTTATYDALDGSKVRVTATVDAFGNRTSVALDPT